MNKINAPYKKLKEIIIGKHNGRMEFRDCFMVTIITV